MLHRCRCIKATKDWKCDNIIQVCSIWPSKEAWIWGQAVWCAEEDEPRDQVSRGEGPWGLGHRSAGVWARGRGEQAQGIWQPAEQAATREKTAATARQGCQPEQGLLGQGGHTLQGELIVPYIQNIQTMLTIFSQNKGREKTNLDMVKDLMSGSGHSGSRLNYRDESSGPIQSPGAGDTTFGQQWSRGRQLRKHGHRRQKNKVSFYTVIYREPSRVRQWNLPTYNLNWKRA